MQTGGYATACPELSAAEKAVIYYYTYTGSGTINRVLHTGNGKNSTPVGQALASALSKLPPLNNELVFSAA